MVQGSTLNLNLACAWQVFAELVQCSARRGANVHRLLYFLIGFVFALLCGCTPRTENDAVASHSVVKVPSVSMVNRFGKVSNSLKGVHRRSNVVSRLPSVPATTPPCEPNTQSQSVPCALFTTQGSKQINDNGRECIPHAFPCPPEERVSLPAVLAAVMALTMAQPQAAALANVALSPQPLAVESSAQRGFPAELDALMMYSSDISSDRAVGGNLIKLHSRPYTSGQIASAIAQWSVLAAIGWGAYGGAAKSAATRLAAATGMVEMPGAALRGTRLALTLNIGREPETWMDPTWARSGTRLETGVAVELAANGTLLPLAVGAYSRIELDPGTWRLDGDTLRFNFILRSGLDRGDLTLPEGDTIYLKGNAWGTLVAKRGTLLVKRTRWNVRQEFRTIGTFVTEPLDDDEDVQSVTKPTRMRKW